MTTHTIEAFRLFAGRITDYTTHKVTSMPGLVRIVRSIGTGNGHGVRIFVPKACAVDLGLHEAGGSIWASACELCTGSINKE